MAYYRKGPKTILVVGNYQKEEQSIILPSEVKNTLINNYHDLIISGREIRLHGYQVLILEL